MTNPKHIQKSLRSWRSSVRAMMRCACFWQIVLSVMLVASPGVGLLRYQVVESLESELPTEETVNAPEFQSTGRSINWHRLVARATRPAERERDVTCVSRYGNRVEHQGLLLSGHRLCNGLCAPLRC